MDERHENKYKAGEEERLCGLYKKGRIGEKMQEAVRLQRLRLYGVDQRTSQNLPENDRSVQNEKTVRKIVGRIEEEINSNPVSFIKSLEKDGRITGNPYSEEDDSSDDESDGYRIKYRGLYSDSESGEEEEEKEKEKGKGGFGEMEKKRIREKGRGGVMRLIEKERSEEVVEEDEEENRLLTEEQRDEEREAKMLLDRRAKRLDDSAFGGDFLSSFGIGESEEKEDGKMKEMEKVVETLTNEEKLKVIEMNNPEIIQFCSELKLKVKEMREKLLPILSKTKKRKEYLKDSGNTFLSLKYRLILTYCMNILFYLYLVYSIHEKNEANKELSKKYNLEDPKNHPVLKKILKCKELLTKLSKFDCDDEIGLLLSIFQEEKEKKKIQKAMNKGKKKEKGPSKKKKRKKKVVVDENERNLGGFNTFRDILPKKNVAIKKKRRRDEEPPSRFINSSEQNELQPPVRKKRKISKAQQRILENRKIHSDVNTFRKPNKVIMKSKGLKDKNKEFLHPRLKHKLRYEKKTRKRRELEERHEREKGGVYDGEQIRKGLVGSRKLK